MDSSLYRAIGVRLRDARKDAKLSQQEVATDESFTRQALSAWERGKSPPSVHELCALCVRYGISADFALFGMRTMPAALGRAMQGALPAVIGK